MIRFVAAIFLCISLNPLAFTQSGNTIHSVAGNETAGFSGDGWTAALAQINWPEGLAFDSAGNLYIADTLNNRVRKVTPAEVISTVAGTGSPGYSGDSGPAIAAKLHSPSSIALDSKGNPYISDLYNGIRKVTPDGKIDTMPSSWLPWPPGALAVDPSDTLYVAESWLVWLFNVTPRVNRITPEGSIVIAGG